MFLKNLLDGYKPLLEDFIRGDVSNDFPDINFLLNINETNYTLADSKDLFDAFANTAEVLAFKIRPSITYTFFKKKLVDFFELDSKAIDFEIYKHLLSRLEMINNKAMPNLEINKLFIGNMVVPQILDQLSSYNTTPIESARIVHVSNTFSGGGIKNSIQMKGGSQAYLNILEEWRNIFIIIIGVYYDKGFEEAEKQFMTILSEQHHLNIVEFLKQLNDIDEIINQTNTLDYKYIYDWFNEVQSLSIIYTKSS